MTIKTFLTILPAITLAPVLALAQPLRIDCHLEQTAFGHEAGVDRISLQTGDPGHIQLQYQDGTEEILPPLAGRAGPFEEIQFPEKFEESFFAEKTYAQVSSPRLGLIQMAHRCDTPSGYFCNPRGTGPATHEVVRLNVGGRLLILDGRRLPLCERIR